MDEDEIPIIQRPGRSRGRPTNTTLSRLEETARQVHTFVEAQRLQDPPKILSVAADLAKTFSDGRKTGIEKKRKIKGRPTEIVAIKVTCLSNPYTTRVNRLDIGQLKRMGLGYPDSEITPSKRVPSKLPTSMTSEDLRDFFTRSFPALRDVDYELGYASHNILHSLPGDINTPALIKDYLVESNRTLSIFIRPREDLSSKCIQPFQPRSEEVAGHSRSIQNPFQPRSEEVAGHSRSIQNPFQPGSEEVAGHSRSIQNPFQPRSEEVAGHSRSIQNPFQPRSEEVAGHSRSIQNPSQPRSEEVAGHSRSIQNPFQPRSEEVAGHSRSIQNPSQPRSEEVAGHSRSIQNSLDHTLFLPGRQQLIATQDTEFMCSLLADKEKDQKRIAEQEKMCKDIETKEKKAQKLSQLILERKMRIVEEPTNGVKLKFKTPTSWNDEMRIFSQNSPVTILQDFVGSLEGATEVFEMYFPNRQQPLSSKVKNKTLEELGIVNNTVVQVKWIEESEAYIIEPEEEPKKEHSENVTENKRPSRRAAQEAISFIRGSCIAMEISDEDDDVIMFGDHAANSNSDADDDTLPLNQTARDNSLIESPEERLPALLTILSSLINRDAKKNIVNVDRDDVLDGGVRAFQRKSFNDLAPISVKFAGEQGIDNGGLTREFLQLAVTAIKKSRIFEGEEDCKNIAMNYSGFEERDYKVYGQIIAYSLVHGGPAPTFFSEDLYNAIAYGPENVHAIVKCVSDYEMRSRLEKIEQSANEKEYVDNVEHMTDVINLAGCIHLTSSISKKQTLLSKICHFLIIGRVSLPLQQFMEGLELCGVLKTMKGNPEAMKMAFIKTDNIKLEAAQVEQFLKINQKTWSLPGSNRHKREKKTQTHWQDLLQDLEEMDKLESLMTFSVGLEQIPPLGITPEPSVEFSHPEDAMNPLTADFPFANTCGNILKIPVLDSYVKFKQNMIAAIQCVTMFTDE